MAAKKKSKKKTKKAKAVKAKKKTAGARKAVKAKKSKAKKAKKTARPAKAKKAVKAKKIVKAKKSAKRRTKRASPLEGEGSYTAARNYDEEQRAFVAANKGKISKMAHDAEAALDGPEGDDLREAEAEGRERARD